MSNSCRDYLKTVFQEEKNTDMNAIKHATKPKIETTFEALKIISQQEKCLAHRSKTHTHTLNKSNQFYISKTSQDSLVIYINTCIPCDSQITIYLYMYQE